MLILFNIQIIQIIHKSKKNLKFSKRLLKNRRISSLTLIIMALNIICWMPISLLGK